MAPKGVQTAVHPNQPSDKAAAASTYGSPTYNPDSPDYDSTLDRSSPYYVPQASTSDTGQEMHNRAENRVDAEDARDDGWLHDLIEKFNHNGRVTEQYSQEMDAQARQLAAAGGQTRQGPIMSCSNYMAWPHSSLKTMVNENASPGDVGTAGDMWINAGNAMVEFQDQVRTAINSSEADWQGKAGNNARGYMADVGNWVGTAGTQAQLAGTQTNRASTSLQTARDTMPEEVPYDAQQAMQDYNDAFWPWDKQAVSDKAWADYYASEEAHQRAAEVVGTYDSNLSGASTMPAFGAPPTMSGDPGGNPPNPPGTGGGPYPPGGGGPNPPGGPGGGPGGGGVPSPGGGGSGGGGGIPGPGGPGGPNGPGGPGGPGSPGGPGFPGGTNPGGAGSGGPGRPGGPGYPGGGGNPGEGGFPGLPVGGGGVPGFGGSDFERGGGGRGGGPGAGGRGFGPGGGGSSSGFGGTSGGPGSGGSGPGAGGRGPGGMGQGGAGALAAEHAAGGGRGLGAGGRGGAGSMGGMGGGGRGQGSDDDEHQRPSYLVEGDPESLFGTDEMTAPPVIGE